MSTINVGISLPGSAGILGNPSDFDAAIRQGATLHHHYHVECYDRPGGTLLWSEDFENRVVTAGLNKYLDATLKTGLTSPTWYVGLVGASISDAAITSGAAALTSASNPWVAADAGSAILVRGAGASGVDLSTTILTYTNAGAVTLAANAGTTVSGQKATWDFRAADIMSSHTPWVESAAYSNANRPAWTPGVIASGSVDNSGSVAVFNMNATSQIFGAFIVDNNTVSGTTGTLLGGGVFSTASQPVISGNVLNVTITLSLT